MMSCDRSSVVGILAWKKCRLLLKKRLLLSSAPEIEWSHLTKAILVGTDLTGATLTGSRIYGISAWDVQLDGAVQLNLTITPEDQPTITVDNLEVAQFIYLLLNNKKIRDVIDTITSKVVLI